MHRKDSALIFSATDLYRFVESRFASWMDRFALEYPHQATLEPPTEEMELLLHMAFAHSQCIRIADDLHVRVAPASVITVLKMVAYLDRPFEREKDLGDLGHLFERYIGHDDERRYSPDVLDSELDFEEVSAFLLGRDVGAVVGDVERRVVASFVANFRQDGDKAATQARMLRQGPRAWNNDPLVLLSRLQAFDRGLGVR